ncbi:unnamed protein product [Thelazia callipaeda]|uniref:Transporter n=1 Tax=Thelazia callipaeda TaxID=103827 RepID=A0A0N5D5B2_THECL|nr:unnamed protein product [Thelazia callipaeda]
MRFTTFADEEGTDIDDEKEVTLNASDITPEFTLDCRSVPFYLCNTKSNDSSNDVRDLWKTQFEFFLSLLGFMVGVGNTLKFPSLAYEHGGGVFLISYFICLFLLGLPIVFMHLCIGQYSGLSASGAFWKLMPIASGIGWTLVILAIPVSIYYNIIVAWSIYYFWFSLKGFFIKELPWSQLLNRTALIFQESQFSIANVTTAMWNATFSNTDIPITPDNMTSPTLGPIQSHLVLSLAFAWILVFFGVFNGIGSIGWAVTVTSTLPYLLLGILLLRGVSLPGASQGLAFLFKPDVGKIWSIPIWKAAAEQVFYSLGIDAGPLISMASFSRYRNNIYRDAVAVVLMYINFILSAMVIFSFIGFIAQNQQRPLDEILQHDPLYIAFTIYPDVTSFMDVMGPLWAALFFSMLTLSAVDAQFAWIEMIVSSIMNKLDKIDKRTETRLVVGLCIICFICGLPLTTRGGIYIFHSIENLNANWNSFSISLLQIIVICYIYGVDNFIVDVGEMLQNLIIKRKNTWHRLKFFFGPTGGYIRWTWSFCSPCILAFLLFASIFSYQRLTLEDQAIPLRYELVGWFMMVGPLVVIPCNICWTLYETWRNNMVCFCVVEYIHLSFHSQNTTELALFGAPPAIVFPETRITSTVICRARKGDEVRIPVRVNCSSDSVKRNCSPSLSEHVRTTEIVFFFLHGLQFVGKF